MQRDLVMTAVASLGLCGSQAQFSLLSSPSHCLSLVVVSGVLFCSFYIRAHAFASTTHDLGSSAIVITVAGIQIPASAALRRT